MIDLHRELLIAQANPETRRALAPFDVAAAIATHCGTARIDGRGGDFYELHPDGAAMIVVPVVECDELIDLIAFDPRQPTRWWQRTGAGSILNHDDLVGTTFPTWLWQTPLRWLQAGCEGVVVLDWPRAASTLRLLDELVTENVAHGCEVRRRLAVPVRQPRISVPEVAAA